MLPGFLAREDQTIPAGLDSQAQIRCPCRPFYDAKAQNPSEHRLARSSEPENCNVLAQAEQGSPTGSGFPRAAPVMSRGAVRCTPTWDLPRPTAQRTVVIDKLQRGSGV